MRRNLGLTGALGNVEMAVAAAARRAVRGGEVASTARAVAVRHVVDGAEDAPVVVLGNSLGSTVAMWDAVAARLRERFRVVRYDLRGHGGSPTPPGPYAIDDLGADLVGLLDGLGIARAHLVGTSIGGMAALWAAARVPERIDRLVVIGSSARLPPAAAWVDRARSVVAEGTSSVAELVTRRWVAPAWAEAHPDAMAGLRAMFAAADPAGYAGCCLAIAGMDLTDGLASISAPTLVAVGSDDPSTPSQHAREIAEGIRDARLVTIEGAAHVPAIDHADEVAALIAEHLA
jgi:3-oxoadipate enol-lactonase